MLVGQEPHPGDGAKLLAAWKPIVGKVYGGSEFEQWRKLALTMLPPGPTLEQSLEVRQGPSAGIVAVLLRFPDAN
jgi:hypothetical protein